MNPKFKTKTISIEVIPEVAVLTLGILKGFLPNIVPIIQQMSAGSSESGSTNDISEILDVRKMHVFLDEVYNKCSVQSSIKVENTIRNPMTEKIN